MFEAIIIVCLVVYGIYIVFMHNKATKIKDPLYKFLFEVFAQMLPWGLLFIYLGVVKFFELN